MDILDEYIKENCLSIESIKSYVDDYSIYSHYIGEEVELGRVFPSPLRDSDEHPSFTLIQTSGGDIVFKDHARNLKGNVFSFLRHLLSEDKKDLLPYREVFNQINIDFDLGLDGTPKSFKPRAKVVDISSRKIQQKVKYEVSSKKTYSKKFLSYFSQYGITEKTLKMYNVLEILLVKTGSGKWFYPSTLCIGYKIGKYYKLYMPMESRDRKFRTDFLPNYVEGFIQLRHNRPVVLITKAMKEVLFFREHFNIDSIAGKSENTMIPEHLMKKLFANYKYVLMWLDRDIGGIDATEAYMNKYGSKLIYINYDKAINQKDPTDRYSHLKNLKLETQAIKEIHKIICPYMK